MIRFLLNDEEITLQQCAADLTVLEFLRARKQCGTKEGCASGDCGACSVVAAQVRDGRLCYQSLNSCITFLGAMHARQLITVEHLAKDDALHPVQQAMVDSNASQCGFCTPGFVMSGFALYKNVAAQKSDKKNLHAQVHEAIAGNLCRCTGYRPIVDAISAAATNAAPDQFSAREKQTIAALKAMARDDAALAGGEDFLIPTSLDALAKTYAANPNAKLLAGGTDLALEVTQQLQSPEKIILLERVRELRRVEQTQTHIKIGAAVTLSECKALFQTLHPSVVELLARFGSAQVRNQGCIGGNLATASPIGDLPPVLLALDASLVLQQGARTRELPIGDFFLDYRKTALEAGEFIREIVLPKTSPQQIFRVYKVSKRLDDDISAVCIAICASLSDNKKRIQSARIAFGGMAAIPMRAAHCEAAFCDIDLTAADLDTEVFARASQALAKDFTPLSDARASANYRLQVAQNLLRRFYLEICADTPDCLRVEHAA